MRLFNKDVFKRSASLLKANQRSLHTMISAMKKGVFISYSHEDKDFIAPVVKLIRGLRQDLVFQDYDNLEVGKPWEPQLLQALAKAGLVVVFWCSHSAKSDWVKKEYRLAIEEAKEVMPIMLDDSEMPHDLSAYQGINMSHFVLHGVKKIKKEKGNYRSGGQENELDNDLQESFETNENNKQADQQRIAIKLFDELTKRI